MRVEFGLPSPRNCCFGAVSNCISVTSPMVAHVVDELTNRVTCGGSALTRTASTPRRWRKPAATASVAVKAGCSTSAWATGSSGRLIGFTRTEGGRTGCSSVARQTNTPSVSCVFSNCFIGPCCPPFASVTPRSPGGGAGASTPAGEPRLARIISAHVQSGMEHPVEPRVSAYRTIGAVEFKLWASRAQSLAKGAAARQISAIDTLASAPDDEISIERGKLYVVRTGGHLNPVFRPSAHRIGL